MTREGQPAALFPASFGLFVKVPGDEHVQAFKERLCGPLHLQGVEIPLATTSPLKNTFNGFSVAKRTFKVANTQASNALAILGKCWCHQGVAWQHWQIWGEGARGRLDGRVQLCCGVANDSPSCFPSSFTKAATGYLPGLQIFMALIPAAHGFPKNLWKALGHNLKLQLRATVGMLIAAPGQRVIAPFMPLWFSWTCLPRACCAGQKACLLLLMR